MGNACRQYEPTWDDSREVLLNEVAALRETVADVAREIREVMRENAELRDEIAILRQSARETAPSSQDWMAEARRIQREVGELVQLHAEASAPPRPRCPSPPSVDRSDWMRRMMMAMAMADMA